MPRPDQRRAMAYTAAGIYGGAAFVAILEGAIPGGERYSPVPGGAAIVLGLLTLLAGPRLPVRALVLLGPLGALLVGVALSSSHRPGDGAVLYMWPVLWMAYFFGRRGTVAIVLWIAAVHAVVLVSLPPGVGSIDRWVDVVVAVSVVAAVVRIMAARNERLVDRLVAEARIDPLTGLLNRRGLDERMAVELARATREHAMLGVVTFDIDHFKVINDEHGHDVGDRVLGWLGRLLTEQARGIDVAARVGGEEFVVLLPGAAAAEARSFAERVRRAVASTRPDHGRERFGLSTALRLSVSSGVAAAEAPGDAQGLTDAADRALYAAKRLGRNRVAVDADGPEPGGARVAVA